METARKRRNLGLPTFNLSLKYVTETLNSFCSDLICILYNISRMKTADTSLSLPKVIPGLEQLDNLPDVVTGYVCLPQYDTAESPAQVSQQATPLLSFTVR